MIRAGNPVPVIALPPSSKACLQIMLAPSQRRKSGTRATWFTRFFVAPQSDGPSGPPYRNVFSTVPENVKGGGMIDFTRATVLPATPAPPPWRAAFDDHPMPQP